MPSHLKLEFDKIKYLPDVVKTIKKRHSISEIESSNTLPPQIFQKILEKHHKNFLDQQNNHQQTSNSLPPSCSSTGMGSSKLNKISEETVAASGQAMPSQQAPSSQQHNNQSSSIQPSNSSNNVKLTTFMAPSSQLNNKSTLGDQSTATTTTTTAISEQQVDSIENTMMMIATAKSTKSIIKQTSQSQALSTDMAGQDGTNSASSRRVNFDPHALLLDAAVEGNRKVILFI